MNLWTHKPRTKKYSPVWYLKLSDKIKEGSIHSFNEKKTKKYHHVPLTIILIRGTPPLPPLQILVIDTSITLLNEKSKDKELKEDRKPTDAPLFVIGAKIYSYNGIIRPHYMPLTVATTSHRLIPILEAPRITQKLVSHNTLTLSPT